MRIEKNYDLKGLNTFGIKTKARFFVEIKTEEDLLELFRTKEFKENKKLFLGGGSNILFTGNFDGIVVFNKLKGIEVTKYDLNFVFIKSYGGELWSDLVNFAVEEGYSGLENLAGIPGTVGAAPVQNIGAYGSELKDVLEEVEAYDIEKGEKNIFSNTECGFGYRESIFKSKHKGKYFISAVILRLNKNWDGKIKYKILEEHIKNNNLEVKSAKDIFKAVLEIRKNKLPDPKVLSNAGSFFKNVFIDKTKAEALAKEYPGIPFFEEEENVKIPAGWLIEKCGPKGGTSWKGYREGSVGVHEKQALVLVNYGGATGKEVKDFSERIIQSVYEKFGLRLEREVNLI